MGCTHSTNPYFDLYTEYKPLGKEDDTELNGIGGFIKTKGIGTILLELEDETGQIHNLTFKQIYYFPITPKLLVGPHKWSQDRGEYEFRREETYLEVMVKHSILVWDNRKSKRTIPHAPVCALPGTAINRGKEDLTKFYLSRDV